MKQYDEALKHYKIVLEMEDRTFPIFVAVCCLQIGRLLEKVQKNFFLSREYFERALSLFENKVFPHDYVNLALSPAVIGNCYYFTGNDELAYKNYLKALNIYEQALILYPSIELRQMFVGCLFKIGTIYQEKLDNYTNAKECFQRIIQFYSTDECPFDSYGLAHKYIGQIIYDIGKNYKQALEHLYLAAKFYETKFKNDLELAECYRFISQIYLKQEKYHQALDYTLKELKLLLQPKELAASVKQATTNDLSFLKKKLVSCQEL
ncbi:unnamed protein product [Didymodactylos carnosus]|uniref:Tetratricopeptide repeat protein n=1 Tax=Didymodactylos carnosus TaxID=1234261 RepID=A0A815KZB9_9BILA|nr:unnamed protein product [Didymodactylos carnosus]CAF4295626.1 unnamed protein product [Didymodactylos carnosus]